MSLQLPLAQLEKFDAQLVESSGGSQIVGPSKVRYGVFPLPVDPATVAGDRDETTTAPGKAAQWAIRALIEYEHVELKVNQDQRLSMLGRDEKLAEHRARALGTLVEARRTLEKNTQGLATQEALRYIVPPMNPNDVVGALQDIEVRNHIRSLSENGKTELFRSVFEGEDSAFVRAILRSPTPFGRLDEAARHGWNSRIDRADPVGRELLNVARQSVAWAERVVAQAQAPLLPKLKYSRAQLLEKVGNDAGARWFQFSPAELASLERLRVARKFAAA